MRFHAIATLSGGRRKVIVNKTEEQILTDCVIPFVSTGVMKAKWGAKVQSYQVLELRVYRTDTAWVKPPGVPLEQFIGKAPNRFKIFEKRAKASPSE